MTSKSSNQILSCQRICKHKVVHNEIAVKAIITMKMKQRGEYIQPTMLILAFK